MEGGASWVNLDDMEQDGYFWSSCTILGQVRPLNIYFFKKRDDRSGFGVVFPIHFNSMLLCAKDTVVARISAPALINFEGTLYPALI